MGFDVIYFPPIHPVGVTARKGRNNSVTCEPGEPGVPYAIGNRHQKCPNGGGHKDVAPELGTLEDFDWLVNEIHARGTGGRARFRDQLLARSSVRPRASGLVLQAARRHDQIRGESAEEISGRLSAELSTTPTGARCGSELASVIEFWCEHGVRIFRVDNPHTKPVAFWEYLITRVQRRWPDAIFLSEAFTKPKMMRVLAKAGFTQSYTYFTWRNTKQGLTDYFTELTQTEPAETMRPISGRTRPTFCRATCNSADGPPFIVRAVLAATLSPVYGIYSGFELCENAGLWKSDWNAGGRRAAFPQSLRLRLQAARQGGVSRLRKISVEGARLECAGQHQGRSSRG